MFIKGFQSNVKIVLYFSVTAQKMKDFFGKCDKIRRKLRIWSHLLEKSLMENFIFLQSVILGMGIKGLMSGITIFANC